MPTFNYPDDFADTGWLVLDGDVYVSSTGSDDTGDGSPTNPYATIQKGVDMADPSQRIVVGTGNYNENVNGDEKENYIVADGLVLMEGNGGDAFSNMGSGSDSGIEGLHISGYENAINNKMALALNCVFKGCIFEDFRGTLQRCVIETAIIRATANTYLYNCTLNNVSTENLVSKTKFKEILDTHIGTSVLFLKSATLTLFDYCNQEFQTSVVNIDGTAYTDVAALHAAFPQYQEHGINVLPQFNDPEDEDYTLQPSSPLLTSGSDQQFIGAFGEASSQNSDTLSGAILTNVNIDDDGKYVLVEGYTEGTIETGEIDLGSSRLLGKINLFAEEHFETPPYNAVVDTNVSNTQPNKITFEFRYSNFAGEVENQPYREFVWNKQPTVDENGNGNGSVNFDPLTAHPVKARYVQALITLRDETIFLLLEDGCFILQENGSVVVLEDDEI
ncbi:MAG: hypothetical protein ACT4ON_08100 [Bacteroidota bacterium]